MDHLFKVQSRLVLNFYARAKYLSDRDGHEIHGPLFTYATSSRNQAKSSGDEKRQINDT